MIAVNNFFTRANEQEIPTTKADVVKHIFDELDVRQVNFVTLRGFDLIPHHISKKQDVDLIIHPDSIDQATHIFQNHGFTPRPIDPKDTVYMYGTHPSIFFVNESLDIAFHVVEELAYKSLHQCEMVPLDEELQASIFKNKRRVDEIWKYMPSAEDEFLMLLCRCIYDKRTISGNYKSRIEKLFHETDRDTLYECCLPVFLKSTPMLLSTIAENRTDTIFERYITFSDY